MTISIDWQNKLVLSTDSIQDIVVFKETIRDLEDDDEGMLYPHIITYKRLDLGGGAYMHGVDFVNGYRLKFPNPGTYEIVGNIGAEIVPVNNVYVERTKAAAFSTTSSGGTGPTPSDIADAVIAALNAITIPVNLKQINDIDLTGTGVSGNSWRPA